MHCLGLSLPNHAEYGDKSIVPRSLKLLVRDFDLVFGFAFSVEVSLITVTTICLLSVPGLSLSASVGAKFG